MNQTVRLAVTVKINVDKYRKTYGLDPVQGEPAGVTEAQRVAMTTRFDIERLLEDSDMEHTGAWWFVEVAEMEES